MSVEVNHCRLVVLGSNTALPGEIWSFGVSLYPKLGEPDDIQETSSDFDVATDTLTSSGTGWTGASNFLMEGGVSDINPLDYLEDQALVAIDAFIAGGSSLFRDSWEVDSLELWPIDSEGKVCQLPIGPAKAEIVWTASKITGPSASGVTMAPFTSFDVELSTIAAIPRGRGRFFPPPVVANDAIIDADSGLMKSSYAATYATRAATMVDDLRLTGAGTSPNMFPVVIGDPYTTAYKVTGTRVNTIPGTQRRRKNQLTADFQTAAV